MLKPNGKLLIVATDSSTTEHFFYVEPNRAELVEIAASVRHFFDRTKTR